MEDKKFPAGVRIYPPHKNAPEWIKGQMVVEVYDFVKYLKENAEEGNRVRFDIKEAKSGGLYLQINTWKKEQDAPKDDEPQIPF